MNTKLRQHKMVYKFPTKRSISPKPKNPFAKLRPLENPYEVWKSPDGTWEYRILKKNQIDDDKPFASCFVAGKTPATFGTWEYGDMYVKDIKESMIKVK